MEAFGGKFYIQHFWKRSSLRFNDSNIFSFDSCHHSTFAHCKIPRIVLIQFHFLSLFYTFIAFVVKLDLIFLLGNNPQRLGNEGGKWLYYILTKIFPLCFFFSKTTTFMRYQTCFLQFDDVCLSEKNKASGCVISVKSKKASFCFSDHCNQKDFDKTHTFDQLQKQFPVDFSRWGQVWTFVNKSR